MGADIWDMDRCVERRRRVSRACGTIAASQLRSRPASVTAKPDAMWSRAGFPRKDGDEWRQKPKRVRLWRFVKTLREYVACDEFSACGMKREGFLNGNERGLRNAKRMASVIPMNSRALTTTSASRDGPEAIVGVHADTHSGWKLHRPDDSIVKQRYNRIGNNTIERKA